MGLRNTKKIKDRQIIPKPKRLKVMFLLPSFNFPDTREKITNPTGAPKTRNPVTPTPKWYNCSKINGGSKNIMAEAKPKAMVCKKWEITLGFSLSPLTLTSGFFWINSIR